MTSRERMLATLRHETPDHAPLYSWVFGFEPAPQWRRRESWRLALSPPQSALNA